MMCIGITQNRILAHDIQRFDRVTGGRNHFRNRHPHFGGNLLKIPSFPEFLLRTDIVDRLISRIDIGQAAHITGPLHIVLTA